MKRSHWIIFIAICLILGLLVFATIIHVINTTPSRARSFMPQYLSKPSRFGDRI